MSDAFRKALGAMFDNLVAQYRDSDWEEAKDVLENVDLVEMQRAFLSAAEANGWRCVPVKMNEAMKSAAHRLNHPRDHEIYEAGVAAAPRIEGEG